MLFQVDNRVLIKDRERTYLTASAAVAGTTLTIRAVDSNAWADNDYIIVGEIGSKTAEVMQVAAAVSDGTSLTIDQSGAGGLRYTHAIDEPVYRIDYNRIEFNRTATDTTTGTAVLTTAEIQPDDVFTRYEDVSNTTGFGFVRFNNETTATFSPYSDGIPYAGQNAKSLAKLRAKVRTLINEPGDEFISDSEIDEALNDRQRDIAHQQLWSFYEIERSLSSIADQFAYDIPSGVKDATIYTATFDTQPLAKINRDRWNMLHWDTDTSTTDPSHINIWNDQVKVYPRPSGSAAATAVNDGGNMAVGDTSVTVDATSSFQRGDYFRFIIDSEVIYATSSTSTTFTGLLRGQEGTTAVSHLDDAAITERDIVLTGQVEPDDLVDINQETSIPEPIVLANGAAADLALKMDKQVLHDRLLQRFETGFEDLRKKYTVKMTGQFTAVKDPREVVKDFGVIRNPNQFPKNVG